MIFQAHKGVSTENPENTMPAFVAAAQQGYKIIELDVSVTTDLQFVLLHDSTVNRTARHANGDLIADTVKISDITYEEALQYDFGIWFSPRFKGTKYLFLKMFCALRSKTGLNSRSITNTKGSARNKKLPFLHC